MNSSTGSISPVLGYINDFTTSQDIFPWVCGIVFLITLLTLYLPPFIERGVNIPIAIEDEIADKKKRIEQYSFDSRNILVKGYRKFKDEIFGIDTTEGTTIVLPIKYIDELKSHPALSFAATFDSLTLPDYTFIRPLPPIALKVFTADLNTSLTAFTPKLHQMIQEGLTKAIPEHSDWTPAKIHPILFKLVCQTTTRILLSAEAANDDRWLELASSYINNAIPYIQALKKWPQSLRPIVYQFIAGHSKLRKNWTEAREIIGKALKQKKDRGGKPLQHPPSFLDHMCAKTDALTIDDHLGMQITLFIAGVHTSAATTTHCIYDAAVNAGIVRELREEVMETLSRTGSTLTRQSLAEMKKMDSFIKEVQRFSSPDLTTFVRKSSKDITLSNGFHVPKGSKIEVATGAINMDDQFFEDAAKFDGLRFYKKRLRDGEGVKHQMISISKNDLQWGYGRHACPGRYMAEIAIKLLFAELLVRFDVKNPEGKPRYANIEFDGQTLPDENAEVMLKSIRK